MPPGRKPVGIESGQLTRREQLQLEQRQDRNSRTIKRARQDGQTRP